MELRYYFLGSGLPVQARRVVFPGHLREQSPWLPPELFAFEVPVDMSLWLVPLHVGWPFIEVNGQRVTEPRRLLATDRVRIGPGPQEQEGRWYDLAVKGLTEDSKVRLGALRVGARASPEVRALGAEAGSLAASLDRLQLVLELAERWRVRSLKRALRWLVQQGLGPEVERIAERPTRETVAALVKGMLRKYERQPRDSRLLLHADAVARFLSLERELPHGGPLSVESDGAGSHLWAMDPDASLLEHARTHVSTLGARCLELLSAFSEELAREEAPALLESPLGTLPPRSPCSGACCVAGSRRRSSR